MLIFDEDRASDSPFVERIWRCHSEGPAPFLSIAASRCELVVGRLAGKVTMTVRGPETRAMPVGDCPAEGEWFGILLKLGTFLPHLPIDALVDTGLDLPGSRTFVQINGSVCQLPTYENADTFVNRLVKRGEIARDPIVDAALQGHLQDYDPTTIQRHFKRSIGLSQNAVRQIERARYAMYLLQAGLSILDTVEAAGYYDQAHLSRSLKHFIGQTPTQIRDHNQSEQLPFLYKTASLESVILASFD
jgi:AraC-like DNA-binding protein